MGNEIALNKGNGKHRLTPWKPTFLIVDEKLFPLADIKYSATKVYLKINRMHDQIRNCMKIKEG